jgi:hypothetical protein
VWIRLLSARAAEELRGGPIQILNRSRARRGFDIHHFVLSSDVLRVITFPESMNGETGLFCSYLGGANEFSGLKIYEILEAVKSAKGHTSGINFVSADRI